MRGIEEGANDVKTRDSQTEVTREEMMPCGEVAQAIYQVRGQKVLIDRDLAALYGVETKVLKQAVRRNARRFPDDFMFVLTESEFANWRSQFVTSNSDRMGLRHPPMAFTEQGVAMLSGVLNSTRAVEVNIAIMRTFVELRKMLESNVKMSDRLMKLEEKYNGQFRAIFDVLNELTRAPTPQQKRIGFNQGGTHE